MNSTSPGGTNKVSGIDGILAKEKPSGSNVATIEQNHQSCNKTNFLLSHEKSNAILFPKVNHDCVNITNSRNNSVDCGERLYDDPCELLEMEWHNSPSKLPRSRSWLCCPHATTGTNKNVFQGNDFMIDGQIPFISEYSNLVTEAPKPQTPLVRFFPLFIHS